MKAVLWTDVFQATMMLVGVLTILIYGLVQEGGINQVWDVAGQGGRLDFAKLAYYCRILNEWAANEMVAIFDEYLMSKLYNN